MLKYPSDMRSEYRIHLNFLPIVGEVPDFYIYRALRESLTEERPAKNIHAYSLCISGSEPKGRAPYWVSFTERQGFEGILVKSDENFDLTRRKIFNALKSNVLQQCVEDEAAICEEGFYPEVRLRMQHHTEGYEELVLMPYRLRSIGKFGFVADFHFRKDSQAPFSRRTQQLSLSLDRSFKRNLDYYLDRSQRITQFVKQKWGILSPLHFDGSDTDILLSQDFQELPAERLNSRTFVFGRNKESRSQFSGLKEYGPLEPVLGGSRLLFMFREQDRLAARKLAMAIRGSKQKERFAFPGYESLFRSTLEIDSNPVVLSDFSEAAMRVALERVSNSPSQTVPVLVLPEGDEAAYLNHKAVFAHAGLATQVCTLGVIENDHTLKWAIANIALQIFCKAGGLPWKVRPRVDSSLIIGISQSHKTKEVGGNREVEKYFAFSVLTESSGLFQKLQVLGEANGEKDYLAQLQRNLRMILLESSKQFSRVVVHTSFKLKRREMEAIRNVVQEVSAEPEKGPAHFAVVKVNHATRFFGVNREVNSLVPFEGTRLKLGHGESLIWFEGIYPDKTTVTKVFPGPTHLQILHIGDDPPVEESLLLQELVDLSGANWRGFNAKSAPVSVFYCHLIADLVHDFHERELPMPAVEGLKPWFL